MDTPFICRMVCNLSETHYLASSMETCFAYSRDREVISATSVTFFSIQTLYYMQSQKKKKQKKTVLYGVLLSFPIFT